MFAGHEANANTLTFAILLLACRPAIQRAVQDDIYRIIGSAPCRDWTYADNYSELSESLVGAVINETLRLYTVLNFIPKFNAETPKSINVSNTSCTMPANTYVVINTSALHTNPKYWVNPEGAADVPSPAASFNPWQWFSQERGGKRTSKILEPVPGSFLPFSDGKRACLGRRFALVELCASLTRILKESSVELAVQGLTQDSPPIEKRAKWEAAKQKAEFEMMANVEFGMSLRMKDTVPVSFVRRGSEDFAER